MPELEAPFFLHFHKIVINSPILKLVSAQIACTGKVTQLSSAGKLTQLPSTEQATQLSCTWNVTQLLSMDGNTTVL